MAGSTGERSSLLNEEEGAPGSRDNDMMTKFRSEKVISFQILPVVPVAAFAIAATSVTSIFAYTILLCREPAHCHDSEQNAWAGTVATASFLANFGSIFALSLLEKMVKRNRKAGLLLWVSFRSISVVVLVLGVYFRSITTALLSRLFQGVASDNILHFNLNAIYAQEPDKRSVSRLISTSLGLYLIGISISPAVAGLFKDLFVSFSMAIAIFTVMLVYILAFISNDVFPARIGTSQASGNGISEAVRTQGLTHRIWLRFVPTFLSPLVSLVTRPLLILPAFSLLLYNTVQSYIFSATVVYTSLRFGFTAKENGLLISTVHAVSAAYLFCALFVLPYLSRLRGSRVQDSVQEQKNKDGLFALLALVTQMMALLMIALATESWQIYPILALSALGLAAPSFIKSYVVVSFAAIDAPEVISSLVMMEILGGLAAPLILGGLQAVWPGVKVFFAAAAMIGGSAMFFGWVYFIRDV